MYIKPLGQEPKEEGPGILSQIIGLIIVLPGTFFILRYLLKNMSESKSIYSEKDW